MFVIFLRHRHTDLCYNNRIQKSKQRPLRTVPGSSAYNAFVQTVVLLVVSLFRTLCAFVVLEVFLDSSFLPFHCPQIRPD